MTDTYFETDFEPAFAGDVPWLSPEQRRRDKIEEELIAVMAVWARDNGHKTFSQHDLSAIRRQFHKVPDIYALKAVSKIRHEDKDAFLDDLANTIEGELIRKAIGSKS